MNLFNRASWQKLATVFLITTWLVLSGCAAGSGVNLAGSSTLLGQSRDYFPGGSQFYSQGVVQSKENFANVEQAQSSYYGVPTQRVWGNIKPARAPGSVNMLQTYYPLSVRWKLKDGREFILENIDVRAIMKEYFKTHQIQLQEQRENRPRATSGDYGPSFVHEIKDDTVILKWFLILNRTPVKDRFTANGAATRWDTVDEEHIVTILKGKPTSGINFKEWVETIR